MRKQPVVVAYDFTQESGVALDRAIDLAAHNPGMVLHFVTALEPGQSYQRAEQVRIDLLAELGRLLTERAPRIDIELFAHVRIGRPHVEILDLAAEIGAELIIVGSHDRGPVGRLVVGSVSEAVLRGARCTVLLARRKGYPDVQLETIVEVPHHKLRPVPHRYEYSAAVSQVRALEWPL